MRQYSQDAEKTAPIVNRGKVTPLPPLSEPVPDLPPVTYSTAKSDDGHTEVTVLSNGLRVASEKKFGQFCTAGGKLSKSHFCKIHIYILRQLLLFIVRYWITI